MVVIAPSKDVYYGNLVAGPIFKKIADKVYATSINIHKELQNIEGLATRTTIPISKNGNYNDLGKVYKELDIKENWKSDPGTWVITSTGSKNVALYRRAYKNKIIPNVVGMDLKDAIYLMENMGIQVEFEGRGVIKEQTPKAGAPITGAEIVKLKFT